MDVCWTWYHIPWAWILVGVLFPIWTFWSKLPPYSPAAAPCLSVRASDWCLTRWSWSWPDGWGEGGYSHGTRLTPGAYRPSGKPGTRLETYTDHQAPSGESREHPCWGAGGGQGDQWICEFVWPVSEIVSGCYSFYRNQIYMTLKARSHTSLDLLQF